MCEKLVFYSLVALFSPYVCLQSVFGVLSAIEGCDAFADLDRRTDISRWYYAVKSAVAMNAGERQTVENHLKEAA